MRNLIHEKKDENAIEEDIRMGIFSKKECSICGQRPGAKGKKLKDGMICMDCMGKLSPFCPSLEELSGNEVRNQILLREQNRQELDSFQRTRVYGETKGKLLIDDYAGKFMIEDGVTQYPDVFSLDAIKGCRTGRLQTFSSSTDDGGDNRSYYTYYFQLIFSLEHPYVQEAGFTFTDESVYTGQTRITEEELEKCRKRGTKKIGKLVNLAGGIPPMVLEKHDRIMEEGERLIVEILQGRAYA